MTRDHWFEDIADHLSAAYLRYSFTKGTKQEVDFIVKATGLQIGSHVLDVGCGPGRHSLELARRGMLVEGIDISEEFVRLARKSAETESLDSATFARVDARTLVDDSTRANTYDVVICLCQGAFGMMREDGDDRRVFAGLASALKPGGTLIMSAFNAYFQVRHHLDADFDPARGIAHEHTAVHNPDGELREVELWTGCYTPRELRLMAEIHGLGDVAVYGAEPGAYGTLPPAVDLPEHLLLARRSAGSV